MGKRKILVVDDEEQIRESLVQFLEARGHRATSSPDAMAGLEHVRGEVDLVITDQRLPGMTGIEFIRAIRRVRPSLPVIMITGYPDLPTVQEARALDAVAFFTKPVDLKKLDRRVEELLGEPEGRRLQGKVLLLSKGLSEGLGEKLSFCENLVYSGREDANEAVQFITQEKPLVILGEVKTQFTLDLLDEYRRRDEHHAAFLVAGDQNELDQISTALFDQGADGGIDIGETAEQIQQVILGCVERLQAAQQQKRQLKETLVDRCMYARPFQRGRHCTYEGPCPFREGWVVINGVEHQKCGKRPLQFDDWDKTGLYVWPTGPVTQDKIQGTRRDVSTLIKQGKKDIVFDLVHVKELHINLTELLSDISDELIATHRDGTMTVINLLPELHGEFRNLLGSSRVIRLQN
jgi:CheY-like chemotaxis protein